MEDWKEAHDKAKEYIVALEAMKDELRDLGAAAIKERDEWKRAYRALMAPPRWLE